MYYVEQNNKIVLFDNNKETLENTILFTPQYEGLEIKEVEEGYTIVDFELMTLDEAAEMQKQQERNRINQLSLTKREVFLALYKDKEITPEQIRVTITSPEALIEFDYANDYFRGNPLIDELGNKLGYTTEDLDYLFENKELPRKDGDADVQVV